MFVNHRFTDGSETRELVSLQSAIPLSIALSIEFERHSLPAIPPRPLSFSVSTGPGTGPRTLISENWVHVASLS